MAAASSSDGVGENSIIATVHSESPYRGTLPCLRCGNSSRFDSSS